MKIEKPDFQLYYQDRSRAMSYWEALDQWFREKAEPVNEILDKGVDVYGSMVGATPWAEWCARFAIELEDRCYCDSTEHCWPCGILNEYRQWLKGAK